MIRTAIRAFGRNDLAGIRRDPVMRMLVVAPFGYAAVVRFPVPALTDTLRERYAFELAPYHPLIVVFFLVLGSAALLAALGGLLLLEEKDARTLSALRVTPLPPATFVGYRAGTVIVVTTLYVVVTMPLSGLVPLRLLPAVLSAGVCAGVLAAVVATLMALVAGNKVEGLAVIRGVGMLLVGIPILPYFVSGPWESAFGVLPSYWPAKIYWAAAAGETVWSYAVVGLCYNAALLWLLLRAFHRRAL